jgi:hypothetical protein
MRLFFSIIPLVFSFIVQAQIDNSFRKHRWMILDSVTSNHLAIQIDDSLQFVKSELTAKKIVFIEKYLPDNCTLVMTSNSSGSTDDLNLLFCNDRLALIFGITFPREALHPDRNLFYRSKNTKYVKCSCDAVAWIVRVDDQFYYAYDIGGSTGEFLIFNAGYCSVFRNLPKIPFYLNSYYYNAFETPSEFVKSFLERSQYHPDYIRCSCCY